jgi:hypothetical protein
MEDDRLAFDTAELRGLAQRYGATRVEIMPAKNGLPAVHAWQFPPWFCPHCGPEQPVQPGCPHPLAAHGTLAEREAEAARVRREAGGPAGAGE